MALVLTAASWVSCGHIAPPAKLGTVATVGALKLTVAGNGVVLASGIEGRPVSGCATVPNSNTGAKPCTSVSPIPPATTAVTDGRATKLTVGGAAVLLTSLKGSTDGMAVEPPATAAVLQARLRAEDAGQTTLHAI